MSRPAPDRAFEPPAVIAHRGFGRARSHGYQENSIEAFRAAIRAGVRWLEIDVRRTADDELFVLHHPTVPGDAGSHGDEFLVDLQAEQVPEQIVRLGDLLGEIPEAVGIVLDVKTSLEDAVRKPSRSTGGLLLPVIEAESGRRPVVVSSFDPGVLVLTGAELPGVPRALITWLAFPLRKAVPAAAQLGVEAVAVHWRSFAQNTSDPAPVHRPTAYSVDVAHRAGLQVVAWCPTLEYGAVLVEAGVDALIVDDVVGALADFRPGSGPADP